ncbi:beta-N-acetylglucosaminidase domain-containing protein [Amycolatopsis palatopharyngis]|uniref:beta-N-acetylglucosaminidase domain-containing protein n=1 Tax=Amycolatopsis palatopharyngis TaxID=187982 RepID=UPI000E249705|nr:beta-N-acetylglucosaminidase domain-containing protein [Amycolatopsis palatopharyngis]
MSRFRRTLVALAAVVTLVTGMLSGASTAVARTHAGPHPEVAGSSSGSLPVVSPTPQRLQRSGPDVVVPGRVEVVADGATDPAARELLVRTLRAHGADRVEIRATASGHAPLVVHLGPADRPGVARSLGDTEVPDVAEGYALNIDSTGHALGSVALGGVDAAGQYYSVQTLRQLFVPADDGGWRIAGVSVTDYPGMPLRGTIEGFYGSPWTHAERLDQLAFYGDVKANTYIYAPKDDPYHRDRWRDPYPAAKLAELGELVEQATAHHVRFTFALSPGTSICYSSASDRQALAGKLQAMYDLGVRSFSIPLDDISYTRWNCSGDQAKYGAPGRSAAAHAQVDLLNEVQRDFVASHPGVQPLQTVPTEYGDLTDTAYKQILRNNLDPEVLVMWTGTDVVPPSITVEQAERASELFGRDVFVWDNYPVNDFGQTAGRLLMAPYDKREPGLSEHVSGIVSNPMNQASASKVVVFTMADFSWNDGGYDRDVSWRQAASYLAEGDPAGVRALLVFFDLNHLAPTFGSQPWQPQAPELASRFERFWTAYDSGQRAALDELATYLDRVAQAPGTIRATVTDEAFLDDADRWLDATRLWGQALNEAVDVLTSIESDDAAGASRARDAMERFVKQAEQIRSVPGENRVEGQVRIGDGVVDVFIDQVIARHDEYLGIPPLRNLSQGRTATQISDWSSAYGAAKSVDGDLNNFSTTSGQESQPWWQVDLGSSVDIEKVEIYNRLDCCADRLRDYHVLVSEQPFTGTLDEALANPAVRSHHEAEQAGRPTVIEIPATGRYLRVWLASSVPQELNMAEVRVFGRGAS